MRFSPNYNEILHQRPSFGNHYKNVIMTTIASQITSLAVVYSTVYSDADQRKHQSSKGPVTWKMFPFDVTMDYLCIGKVLFPSSTMNDFNCLHSHSFENMNIWVFLFHENFNADESCMAGNFACCPFFHSVGQVIILVNITLSQLRPWAVVNNSALFN